ncbi:phenolic glucoside malonyltransferase 1-like [Cucurbita maxima]|uniref:Phenolic glucoside malonyltransferase 1-like n=1 Tax=Cucurbita maxima TaxID=3661 RepID=A0A6J1K841_CUCMA|nr:phenolic glucoside malonyltransferase 1-like [Cucurbita maxima]
MAEMHPSVNVLHLCTVPLPHGSLLPFSLPLTFFDILWLRFPPVQRIFFYKSSAPFDVVVSTLKNSLSAALQHYPPLAGAVVWPENSPKPAVQTVLGDGILLTLAKSDSKFSHLVSDELREAAEFHTLVPRLPAADDRAAVMALQVTSFGTEGFCIGITSHHAILDGRTSTSFVKLWARLCKNLVAGGESAKPGSTASETMPFYDRSVIVDPKGLEGIFLRDWLAHGGSDNKSLKFWPPSIQQDLFRGTFKFNPQNIQKLKQLVLNRWNPVHPPPVHISTFTVAMAYTWVCTAVADGSPHDGEISFGLSVDARRWLDPPVPANYFGNCLVGRTTDQEKAKLVGENGLVTAVEGISKAIKSLEENGALDGAEQWVSMLTQVAGSNRKMLTTAGSPRFELYSVDFGWGTPAKVEVVSIDGTGAVSVCDGRDGGVELGWVAKKDVMEAFAAAFAKGLKEL